MVGDERSHDGAHNPAADAAHCRGPSIQSHEFWFGLRACVGCPRASCVDCRVLLAYQFPDPRFVVDRRGGVLAGTGGVEFLPHLSLAGNCPTPGGLRAASGSGVCDRLLAVHGGGDDVRDGTHQRRTSFCRRHVRRDARDDVAEISRPQ